MKHIKKFLESTDEGNLDILEYFFDIYDKWEIELKSKDSVILDGEVFVQIKFDPHTNLRNNYKAREIIEDLWRSISMIRSVGEFSTFRSVYASITWDFKGKISEKIPLSHRRVHIGDRELSNFNNLLGSIRSETIKSLVGRFREDSVRSEIQYINGDFEGDLLIESIGLYFYKQ